MLYPHPIKPKVKLKPKVRPKTIFRTRASTHHGPLFILPLGFTLQPIHFPEEQREEQISAAMVKFLKPNKAVIILQGRYAGRKAVIIRNFDDGTRDRAYGHCLVAGLAKYPRKVIRKDSAKKQAKKSRVKCFIKLVNYNHIMPTRYTLDVDLKDVLSLESLQSRDKKVTAAKEAKARFEERFKTGKNRWFFTKLRF
ncbi:60S ribosomal L27 [Olea europaea subsp. europaea]|uniref:60S ribosomal protein L27 n=2 Tax=Olea europaea subsp. europaea TaxID=158383 RepID=A0A8S0SWD1_OLEEU|nr:60S ribosomal L27 [Olea europaea subsp. europaea]